MSDDTAPDTPSPGIQDPTPLDDLDNRARTRVLFHPQMPAWIPRTVVFAVAVFILSGFVVDSLGRLDDLLLTVAMSFLLACALEPPVNALASKGMRRGLATLLVIGGVLAAVGAMIAAIGAMLVGQVRSLIDNADDVTASVVNFANTRFGTDLDAAIITRNLTEPGGILDRLQNQAADFGLRSLAVVGPVLMGLLFTFYLVADGPKLRRAVCSMSRPSRQREILRAWDLAIEKAGGYMLSRVVIATISAVVHSVGFAALSVPYPLALGVWMGLLSQLVPVVGTYLGAGLPLLVALTVSPGTALGVLVLAVVYGQLENLVISPRITRRTMSVHPALGLFAVVSASTLVGPVGALLALPVVGTCQAFFSSYVTRHPLIDSPLTTTDDPRTDPARPSS